MRCQTVILTPLASVNGNRSHPTGKSDQTSSHEPPEHASSGTQKSGQKSTATPVLPPTRAPVKTQLLHITPEEERTWETWCRHSIGAGAGRQPTCIFCGFCYQKKAKVQPIGCCRTKGRVIGGLKGRDASPWTCITLFFRYNRLKPKPNPNQIFALSGAYFVQILHECMGDFLYI